MIREMLEKLTVKELEEKGYELVTVSDLIYKENYTIDNNGVQHKIK